MKYWRMSFVLIPQLSTRRNGVREYSSSSEIRDAFLEAKRALESAVSPHTLEVDAGEQSQRKRDCLREADRLFMQRKLKSIRVICVQLQGHSASQ